MTEQQRTIWQTRHDALKMVRNNWSRVFPSEPFPKHSADFSQLKKTTNKIDVFTGSFQYDPFYFIPREYYMPFLAAMDTTYRWDGITFPDGSIVETVLEHTLALHQLNHNIMHQEPCLKSLNQKAIRGMFSSHDIPEIILGDKNAAHIESAAETNDRHSREELTLENVLLPLIASPQSEEILNLYKEYESQTTTEAKYVKWIDRLQGYEIASQLSKLFPLYADPTVRDICDGRLEKSRNAFIEALPESDIKLSPNTSIAYLFNCPAPRTSVELEY